MSQLLRSFKKFVEDAASLRFFKLMFCLLFIGLAACTGSAKVSENENDSSAESDKMAEEKRLEQLYWTRVDSAKMQFTQADVDFMNGMIAHHAQALIMSDLAPENGAGSAIQTLAARIINAQKDEIDSMQRWLRERNQPVPEVHIEGLILTIRTEPSETSSSDHGHMQHSHSVHAGMDHSGMPGMLTQDQLNELDELKGDAFDKTFLQYMIEHHRGAVVMVRELFNTDGAARDNQAFRLASDIQADQITEIERMKQMLQKMTDS